MHNAAYRVSSGHIPMFVQAVKDWSEMHFGYDVQSGKIPHVSPDAGSKMRKLESFRRVEVKERPSWVDAMAAVSHAGNGVNVPVFEPVDTFPDSVEEDMPDYEEEQPPVVVEVPQPPPVLFRIPEVIKSPMHKIEEEETKQKKKRRMEEIKFEEEEHEKRRLKHEADAAAGRAVRQALAAEARRQDEKLRGPAHKAEADIGKQRLWFRKWRRRALAKALERQQKLERAEAALNTLSLGVPLRKAQVGGGDFLTVNKRGAYLEQIMEERAMRLQQLWAPVRIPRLVLPILHQINPSQKSLYWSVLLSAGGNPVGEWVRSKISSKELPVATEESAKESNTPDTQVADERKIFYDDDDGTTLGLWYTAKEVHYGKARDFQVSFHGTSGLIFVSKGDEPVSVEQTRLNTLVQAVPDGVSVPLLVLSARAGSTDDAEAERTSVIKNWDLLTGEMTQRKASDQKVFFIGLSPDLGDKMTYFYEEALVEGLEWLAEHSPVQPELRSILVVDLVKEHLDPHLDLQLKVAPADLRPEHCITVFNKALEKAADEIKAASRLVPLNWPPDSRSGQKLEGEEGDTGWNHKRNLESVLASLQSCLLLTFPAVPNFDDGEDLTTQKVKLESLLLEYLSALEGTSADNPTMRWEVNRVVQRSCTVGRSRRGSYLIPKWARMFQVLFTNRLLVLNRMQPAPVYIRRLDKRPPLELLDFEKSFASASQLSDSPDRYFSAEPSLDDLISVTAYDHGRRTMLDELEQSKVSSVEQTRTPLGRAASRLVPDSYQSPKTPSTPEVWSTPVKSRHGASDEAQKQEGGSSISQHDADWLVFRTSIIAPEQLQLDITESELLLDDMIQELEMWESRPSGNLLNAGVFSESPDSLDKEEIPGAYGEDLSRIHVPSDERRKPVAWTAELELTDSEILLGNLVAEFGSIMSGKRDGSPSKSIQCNGDLGRRREFCHGQPPGTEAALGIS
ncbi:hypothetical protein R1sor_003094 [Riccia sorocarpa]|uniref:Uncharacterized protein n=1 Tax=Riccia sorocarpa TaxID=122646 RepID=A0ABD3H3P0_9MARC